MPLPRRRIPPVSAVAGVRVRAHRWLGPHRIWPILLAIVWSVGLVGCSPSTNSELLELRIEKYGAGDADVSTAVLRREGLSEFVITDSRGNLKSRGSLDVNQDRFDAIVREVSFYRPQAIAVSSLTPEKAANAQSCGDGEVFAHDADGMHIEWRASEERYIKTIYFGCDPERNSGRFDQLRQAFDSLLIPSVADDGVIDP